MPELQKRFECKFDRMSRLTGNFAVEIGKGIAKPTGITTSAAHIYVYGDGEKAWFFPKYELWMYCVEHGQIRWGGDGREFLMWVIPCDEVIEALQPRTIDLKVRKKS